MGLWVSCFHVWILLSFLGELMSQKELFLPSLLLPKMSSSSSTLEEMSWLNQTSNSMISSHIICFDLLAVSARGVGPGTGRVHLLWVHLKTLALYRPGLSCCFAPFWPRHSSLAVPYICPCSEEVSYPQVTPYSSVCNLLPIFHEDFVWITDFFHILRKHCQLSSFQMNRNTQRKLSSHLKALGRSSINVFNKNSSRCYPLKKIVNHYLAKLWFELLINIQTLQV